MRVLMTGIDGFVGSHAAEFLLGVSGVEVHGTVIPSSDRRNILAISSKVHLHTLDILDEAAVREVIVGLRPDRILHFAAQAFVPTSVDDPAGTFRTNIMGGLSILEAARAAKKERGLAPAVLMVSTGEVYGRVEADQQPITEDHPIRPANPYAASKASIDLIAQEYRKTFDVDVTVARPFNHIGPRQSPLFVCSDFGRQIAGIALGGGSGSIHVGDISVQRDFLDVRDVVRAYWMLFGRKGSEFIYNVCSGTAVRISDILSMFEEISGVRATIVPDVQRARAYDIRLVVGNCDRLRNATGWSPAIPLRQTLTDVYAYWRSELSRGR